MSALRGVLAGLTAVVAMTVAGCSGATGADTDDQDTITVFAAASLQSTFTDLGHRFEARYPQSRVVFNFAGSSSLFTQLDQGAAGDVFASADTANMTKAVQAGLTASEPVNFATNVLTIVVPPGNPAGIRSFADLARPDVRVVICAPQVPCGTATKRIEDATGVHLQPVSEESSVTDVLGKVVTAQADAGVVYVTEAARARDQVEEIAFPEAGRFVNAYPIAVLDRSGSPDTAKLFVSFVLGREGREVLSSAGFGTP